MNPSTSKILFVIFCTGVIGWGVLKEKRKKRYNNACQLILCDLRTPQNRTGPLQTQEPLDDYRQFSVRKAWFQHHAARCNFYRDCSVRIVHVAGTKGKGSVCELIRACLTSNGQRVGTFTSPHLHSIRERIRVDSNLIPQQDFTRLVQALEPEFSQQPWMSFFDKLLAIAIAFFGEKSVDFVILETGIGGRFDSTNFIEAPACAVITSISFDHQQLLGHTLTEIASQKAGILKHKGKAFTCVQTPEVQRALFDAALSVDASLEVIENNRYPDISCSLSGGRVQEQNLQLAVAVARHLGITPTGMNSAKWPCRFEIFELQKKTVILDGAHNEDSMQKLFAEIKNRYGNRRVHCIFGALAGKNIAEMLTHVCRNSVSLRFAKSAHQRSLSEPELLDILRQRDDTPSSCKVLCGSSGNCNTVHEVFEEMLVQVQNMEVLVVCGSLFLSAEARQSLLELKPKAFAPSDWIFEL